MDELVEFKYKANSRARKPMESHVNKAFSPTRAHCRVVGGSSGV